MFVLESMLSQSRGCEAADILGLRFVNNVAISPDGESVAYTLMQPNAETNRNDHSLWIIPSSGGKPVMVAAEEPQDPAPAWAPDSSTLAFVGRRGVIAQIHVLDVAGGGEAQQLTDGGHHATSPVWSPDGSQLLYICRVPALPEPRYPLEFPANSLRPKVITRRRYKLDGMGWFDHQRNQLFVVATSGGEPRQLTTGETGIGHPVWTAERGLPIGKPTWSPDGAQIAFVMNPNEDEEDDRPLDVWTVDVESGNLTRITPHDGLYAAPAWSPDGRRLAVIGTPYPRKVGFVNRLWTVPASGGSLTRVGEDDLALGSGVMSDTGAPSQGQPVWLGDQIYCLAATEGVSQVWSVAANGGNFLQVTSGQHALGSWSLSANGSSLCFCASTPTNPGEVNLQRLSETRTSARRLTELNAEILSDVTLSDPEEFWTNPPDGGQRIHGWILKPPGFSPSERYPLVLEIHGGPTALYGMSWMHEFQMLASKGYVVVSSNPRGSAGYGQEFASAVYRDWCDGPTTDVLAALDHVIALGYVDPDRLYVTGGSYGGYMVNWVITQTDRFRAAVAGRSISDLRTMVLADDVGSTLAEHFGGMPWEEPELYAYGSPITHIASCKTPLLIEHQEADHRCPMDQAEQMYNALKTLKVPVEMVLYPNESHGMSRNGTPLNRVDRLLRMLDWFERN